MDGSVLGPFLYERGSGVSKHLLSCTSMRINTVFKRTLDTYFWRSYPKSDPTRFELEDPSCPVVTQMCFQIPLDYRCKIKFWVTTGVTDDRIKETSCFSHLTLYDTRKHRLVGAFVKVTTTVDNVLTVPLSLLPEREPDVKNLSGPFFVEFCIKFTITCF